MTISFQCPKCKKSLRASEEFAGGSARCQGCQTRVRIPNEAACQTTPGQESEVTSSNLRQAATSQPLQRHPKDSRPRGPVTLLVVIGFMVTIATGIIVGLILNRPQDDAVTPVASMDEERHTLDAATSQTGKSSERSPDSNEPMAVDQFEAAKAGGVGGIQAHISQPIKSTNEHDDSCFAIWESERLDRFGVMDRNGNVLIEPSYPTMPVFYEGLAAVEKSGKIGFIDCSGEWVIPPRFDADGGAWRRYARFSSGVAVVKHNRFFVYIDRHGKTVIEGRFMVAEPFQEENAYVWRIGQNGQSTEFIDRNGKTAFKIPNGITPLASQASGPLAQWATVLGEGMLPVSKDGRCGYLDRNGQVAIPFRFEKASGFSEGMAAVKIGGRYGFIDKSGRIRIEAQFDDAQCFRDGRAPVKVAGKWGFVDANAKLVIAPRFADALPFSEDRAAVKTEYTSGFIDKKGNWIVQAGTLALPFRDGVATFVPYGNIDRDGRLVWIAPDFRHLDAASLQEWQEDR